MVYKSRPGKASIPERAGLLILILCALPGMVCAQDKPQTQQLAAPPMKALSREERTELESIKDEKSRVKRTLALMATRLQQRRQRPSGIVTVVHNQHTILSGSPRGLSLITHRAWFHHRRTALTSDVSCEAQFVPLSVTPARQVRARGRRGFDAFQNHWKILLVVVKS